MRSFAPGWYTLAWQAESETKAGNGKGADDQREPDKGMTRGRTYPRMDVMTESGDQNTEGGAYGGTSGCMMPQSGTQSLESCHVTSPQNCPFCKYQQLFLCFECSLACQ